MVKLNKLLNRRSLATAGVLLSLLWPVQTRINSPVYPEAKDLVRKVEQRFSSRPAKNRSGFRPGNNKKPKLALYLPHGYTKVDTKLTREEQLAQALDCFESASNAELMLDAIYEDEVYFGWEDSSGNVMFTQSVKRPKNNSEQSGLDLEEEVDLWMGYVQNQEYYRNYQEYPSNARIFLEDGTAVTSENKDEFLELVEAQDYADYQQELEEANDSVIKCLAEKELNFYLGRVYEAISNSLEYSNEECRGFDLRDPNLTGNIINLYKLSKEEAEKEYEQTGEEGLNSYLTQVDNRIFEQYGNLLNLAGRFDCGIEADEVSIDEVLADAEEYFFHRPDLRARLYHSVLEYGLAFEASLQAIEKYGFTPGDENSPISAAPTISEILAVSLRCQDNYDLALSRVYESVMAVDGNKDLLDLWVKKLVDNYPLSQEYQGYFDDEPGPGFRD